MADLALQHHVGASSSGAGTAVAAPALALAAGQHVFVFLRHHGVSDVTVTDTAGNTYTLLPAFSTAASGHVQGRWAYCLAALEHAANVVSITTAVSTTSRDIRVFVLAGDTPGAVTPIGADGQPASNRQPLALAATVGAGGALLFGLCHDGAIPFTWSQSTRAPLTISTAVTSGATPPYSHGAFAAAPAGVVNKAIIATINSLNNSDRMLCGLAVDIGGAVPTDGTTHYTTAVAVEALRRPVPVARTSQLPVEVLQGGAGSANVRTSQLPVEVLRTNLAVPVNDRDVLIGATHPRHTLAPGTGALLLATSGSGFAVGASGGASPSVIALSALLINVTGTVAWSTSDGTLLAVAGNHATLPYAAMATGACVVSATLVTLGVTFTASTTITKVFSGAIGASSRVAYSIATLATLAATPASLATAGASSYPPNGSWGTGTVWGPMPTTVLAAGETLYRTDGTLADGVTIWSVPYMATLKVGQLSALTVDAGNITAGDFYGTTMHGGPGYPHSSYTWPGHPTDGGFHLSAAGLMLGNFTAGTYVKLDANGDFSAPGLTVTAGVATFSGALLAVSGTFGTITAGRLQNAANTNFIELNATGTDSFLKVGSAVDIKADGSGFFARQVVSPPNLLAQGTATTTSPQVGAGSTWTIYIDTGVNTPGGWASSTTDMYGASATIASGLSYSGGTTGYATATVVHGDGLTTTSTTLTDKRLYIKYTWEGPAAGGGSIVVTSVDWKLVRL